MLNITYADCLGLSLAILSQFTVEMCAAAKIAKNSTKPLWVQGHSRLQRSLSPVLVMIGLCSKSIFICNHFHTWSQ